MISMRMIEQKTGTVTQRRRRPIYVLLFAAAAVLLMASVSMAANPVANDDPYSVDKNTQLSVNAANGVLNNDTDADSDPLTAVLNTDVSHGTLTLSSDGSFTYDPTTGYDGTDQFTYFANDGTQNSASAATVTITITNNAPVANNDPSYATAKNVNLNVNAASGVLANDTDADGDDLTAVLDTDVSTGALTLNADGSFVYDPPAPFKGIVQFTYFANDGTENSATAATVTINVANTVPVANNDNYNVDKNQTLNVNAANGVLDNDSDGDGDPLTAVLNTDVSHGTLTLSSDGSFSYTPTTDYNGSDQFTYFANDGSENSATAATVTITVNNNAPVANNDPSYNAPKNGTLNINAASGVLANDTDADGDDLTAVLNSNVSHGTLNLNSNGSFSYTPTPGYDGTDQFTYFANDGAVNSATAATVTITVSNSAPVANNDASYSTNKNTTLNISAPGVLGNDTDADNDDLTAVLNTDVSNGNLTLNSNGSFTYTPDNGFDGTDQFTYFANDGTTNSNSAAVVSIQVSNHTPLAVDDEYFTDFEVQLVVSAANGVLQNDSDPDGDDLEVTLQNNTSNGALALNLDGSFTYTPNSGFNGIDQFTYRVSDGTANSSTATVVIHVGSGNTPPVAVGDTYSANKNQVLNVSAANGVLKNDTDADSDPLTAVLNTNVSHGTLTFSTDGSFTYAPTPGFSGSDAFTYFANDGTDNSNSPATVNITVVNHAPVANNDPSYTVGKNEPLVVNAANGVLNNDTDSDGDDLTVGNPRPANDVDHGNLTLNADGSFTYTPDNGFEGTDQFTYFANDGTTNSSSTATATITVSGDPPTAVNDSYETDQNQPLTIAAPGVLSNDTDADGDDLTAVLNTTVSHGNLTLNSNGSFSYTPATDFHGTDQFTYFANDGHNNSTSPATVVITVSCPCSPPTASAQSIATTTNTAVAGTLTGTIPCEGPTYTLVTQPGNGSVTGLPNSTGTFTFTPGQNFSGTTSFTFRVTDQCDQQSAAATVTVNVLNIGAPVVQMGTRNADCGTGSGDPQLSGDDDLVITNNGGGTITISAVTIESDPNGEFTIDTGTLPATLDVSESATFPVSYCPVDEGSDAADVRISFDVTAASAQTDLVLTDVLAGQGALPSCTIASSFVFPGNTQSGNQSVALLPITNTSSVIVRIDGAATDKDTLFDVVTPLPHYILPTDPDTTGVEIRFSPNNVTADMLVNDIITLTTNTGDKQVTLNAGAVPQTWDVTEQAVITVPDNCSCESDEFTIQNATGENFLLLSLTTNNSLFTISGFTPPLTILSGRFAGPFTLEYCPDGRTGTLAAELSLTYKSATDPQASEITVNVPVGSGTADAPIYSRETTGPLSETVAVGETATYTVAIKNTGGTGLTIACAGLSEPFSVTSGCPATIAPNTTQNVVIKGQSNAADDYSGTLTFTTNGYSGDCTAPTTDQIVLNLTVEDRQAPVFRDSVPGILDTSVKRFAEMGKPDTLRGRIFDETSVERVFLRLRRPNGLESDTVYDDDLRRVQLDQVGDEWEFEFIVPNSFTNSTGYEYLLSASDGSHLETLDWVSRTVQFASGAVSRPNDTNHGTIRLDGRWYMLAAPAVLSATTPDLALRAGAGLSANEDDWKLYPAHDDGDTTSSLSRTQPVFTPGSAVWFRHVAEDGTPALNWSLPAGTASPLAGSSNDTYSISLVPGPWTMFSNPFPFDVYVKVDATFLVSGTSAFLRGRPTGYSNEDGGEVITSADATNMEFREDGSGQKYAVLRPWVGYAIRRTSLSSLVLTTHPETDPSTWTTVTPAPSRGPGITMSLTAGTRQVGQVICGLGEKSSDGWDWTDRPVFPRPRAAGTFYIKHDDWGDYSDRYVIDRRAATNSGSVYSLAWNLAKAGDQELRLTVEEFDPLPSGQSAVLYDRATGTTTELRAGTVYTFRSGLQRDDQRFAVLVGDPGFTDEWAASEESNRPSDFRLSPNYPNPFNAGTVIEFQLTEYSDVQLTVFNILGQQVRTLIDRPMYPGAQSVQFDGRDDHYQALPTGVYFYRLTTNLGSISRKMVLLK